MTRPTILDLDLVVVPSKADVGMLGAWYRYKSGHHFAGEEPARDTSDVGAYHAMLSASPYPTAWDDVREYVEGLETEVERLKDELGDPDGVVAHANSITELFEARIAELEKRLADADRVIEPFADRAGKLDGIWKDHETQWSPEYGNTAITIGHLRAARAYMEGK